MIPSPHADFSRRLLIAAAVLITCAATSPCDATPTDSSLVWREAKGKGYTLHYTDADTAIVRSVSVSVTQGIRVVEKFFGAPFPKPFDVRLFPARAALDGWWRAAWHVPDLETECWMVASGTGPELDVLSPRVWKTEACEHDPADSAHTARLLTHEIVHVYHGQHNPRPDFDGLDAIGWFPEGLATYVSGQLAHEHAGQAREAIESDKAPARLEDGWSGKYRYAVSGSLVHYVDTKWGRKTVTRMMADTSEAGILSRLHTDEATLLRDWRESEMRSSNPPASR
jgi:hypothetical protein